MKTKLVREAIEPSYHNNSQSLSNYIDEFYDTLASVGVDPSNIKQKGNMLIAFLADNVERDIPEIAAKFDESVDDVQILLDLETGEIWAEGNNGKLIVSPDDKATGEDFIVRDLDDFNVAINDFSRDFEQERKVDWSGSYKRKKMSDMASKYK